MTELNINSKLNGKLTDRARIERKYLSSILGVSNTTEYHVSYLARLTKRNERSFKRLIHDMNRKGRINATIDGSTVIFA